MKVSVIVQYLCLCCRSPSLLGGVDKVLSTPQQKAETDFRIYFAGVTEDGANYPKEQQNANLSKRDVFSNLLPFCFPQPYGACSDKELKVNSHYRPKLMELLINKLERC